LSPAATTIQDPESTLDQHYIDDLRAGAFQYIEAETSDQTKPYQVKSDENLSG
jgi:hypothetical protein